MHTEIVGLSESGKTWAAKRVANNLSKGSYPVGVFDPKYAGSIKTANEWSADFITNDKKEFQKHVWTNTDFAYFFDEAWLLDDRRDRTLTTLGRGLGHSFILIAQRATQIDKTLRDQCTACLAFTQSSTDARQLRDNFVGENLLETPTYRCGQFAIASAPHQLFLSGSTYEESGLKHLETLADLIIDVKPEADEEMIAQHGCYGRPNWDYLKDKGLIYD